MATKRPDKKRQAPKRASAKSNRSKAVRLTTETVVEMYQPALKELKNR